MSQQNSETPQPDIYVGLLFVSLAAVITGIIFLMVELRRYDMLFK
jgi:hypothetical protein